MLNFAVIALRSEASTDTNSNTKKSHNKYIFKHTMRTSVGDLLTDLSRLAHQATKKAHFLHGRVRGRGGSGGVLGPLAEQNNANIGQNDGLQDGVGELGGPEFDQEGFEIIHVVTDGGGHDVHLVAL